MFNSLPASQWIEFINVILSQFEILKNEIFLGKGEKKTNEEGEDQRGKEGRERENRSVINRHCSGLNLTFFFFFHSKYLK